MTWTRLRLCDSTQTVESTVIRFNMPLSEGRQQFVRVQASGSRAVLGRCTRMGQWATTANASPGCSEQAMGTPGC